MGVGDGLIGISKTTASDVCIVGGGPGGLAASLALRKQGLRVTVIDRATPPIDKACGEGLMPDSVAALRRLGVEIPAAEGHSFKGIRFSDGHSAVTGHFPLVPGIGIRRLRLHALLIKKAVEAKVNLIWDAKHVQLSRGGVRANGQFMAADLVVGADGHNSLIRATAGLGETKSERKRFGFRRHYRVAPWSDYVELCFGPRGQLYITPVAKDEVCVVFLSNDPKLRLDEALTDFPAALRHLAGAPHASNEMGALSLSRRLAGIHTGSLALLGDASGSIDTITGEGLCLAFKQSMALAQSFERGGLKHYAARHRDITLKPRLMEIMLLTLADHSIWRRKALAGLAKNPKLFEGLLKFHLGQASLLSLCSRDLFGFGLDCVTA